MTTRNGNSSSTGFNLIELCVVIAIVSVLALLVLPALANNDSRGQIMQCLNNQKQLASAWLLYADDNNGRLVSNLGGQPDPTGTPGASAPNPTPANPVWAYGNMQFSSDQTNADYIRWGLLFPYTKTVALYKCPGNQTSEIRGVSMNSNLAGQRGSATWQTEFDKTSSVSKPSNLFVTIDESPITINDGMFFVIGQQLGNTMTMNDWPANYHGGASGISFADGHAEMHLWRYLGAPPAFYNPAAGAGFLLPQSTDIQYLVMISTLPSSGSW